MEETKPQENKEQTEKNDSPECPLCNVAPILMSIGAGHTACSIVEDPEKKAKCMAWIDGVNPEEIKNAEDIFAGILENAGMEEANRTAKTFNLGMRNAIIRRVGQKLENGETVDPMELAAYKKLIAQGV